MIFKTLPLSQVTNQAITHELQKVLEFTQKQNYSSFKLVTELTIAPSQSKSTKNETHYISLTHFDINNPKTDTSSTFKVPNVFAPIIANRKSAEKQGTIFYYETKEHIVIKDKFPAATFHALLIPKEETQTILDMPIATVGTLFFQAITISSQVLGLSKVKLVVNVAPPNQEIPHVHLHIMSNQNY